MTFNPFRLQHAMNPEAIEASFLDRNNWKTPPNLRLRFLRELRKAGQ